MLCMCVCVCVRVISTAKRAASSVEEVEVRGTQIRTYDTIWCRRCFAPLLVRSSHAPHRQVKLGRLLPPSRAAYSAIEGT